MEIDASRPVVHSQSKNSGLQDANYIYLDCAGGCGAVLISITLGYICMKSGPSKSHQTFMVVTTRIPVGSSFLKRDHMSTTYQ